MGRYGGRGGVWRSCLGIFVIALVLVCAIGAWVFLRLSHDRHVALGRMEDTVAATKSRLERSAVDGDLLGTEIERDLPLDERYRQVPPNEVRRAGRIVTVIAQFTGNPPGLTWRGTDVTGCYRFRSVPPSVSVSRLPDDSCHYLYRHYPAPAAVARDVVTEMRTSVERAGLGAVPAADVWHSPGLDLVHMEAGKGRFAARALLLRDLDAPQCYEFRARAEPSSVTGRRIARQQCASRQQNDWATLSAAAGNAELEASAGKIEQRIRRAVADGRLTDAELERALALPRTDGRGRPVMREPVGVLLARRQSATEVVLTAKIENWQQYVTGPGCYEFRASLTRRSVTRLRMGNNCLSLPSP
ncbi:hypothetical protein [Streptomyces sediminimaris]|uniref:hypothetical protein n=1 Tax=Streptomyces sediminimaris TaxID=3383721 RepID=UPI003999843B